MPAGRPPLPMELKRKRGTARTDSNQRVAVPPQSETLALRPADGVPPVPIGLGSAGRTFWPKVWSAAAWLSLDLDMPAIEQACYVLDEVEQYRTQIQEEGIQLTKPVVTPAGMVVGEERYANPLIKQLRDASTQLQKWLSELGFNPTARAKLGLAEVRAKSAFEELQDKRNKKEKAS